MSLPSLEAQDAAKDSSPQHIIRELPVVVLLPHSRCNCRCVMCDIWRIRQIREISAADLNLHIASFRELKVQWLVFSGGEPLMHSDLFALARILRGEGIRTTVLTAGLTLERHAAQVAEYLDDVIVSLDGPREIHDRIRGVPDAYLRLQRGIEALRTRRSGMPVHGRCTVQKHNFRHLRPTANAAHESKLDSLSFLAADISSTAFNHEVPRLESIRANIALSVDELYKLDDEIEALIRDCHEQIQSGFIRESPEKLRRISSHFKAHLGQAASVTPRCNAPWVSTVIESDGAVRPCFFHRPIGNLRDGTLAEVLNSKAAIQFRSQLDVSKDAICGRCVCSLFLDNRHAGVGKSTGE
jgi:MoaA/NifB/PqqE/SkfB family radical SAM enzyme